MHNKPNKYFFRVSTLILLMGFLLSNVSFSQFIVNKCQSEMTSDCCKNSNNSSHALKIEKPCCCEIKEASNQPLESVTAITQIQNKIFPVEINHYAYFQFFQPDANFNYKPISFHSLASNDLNILNSNFRI